MLWALACIPKELDQAGKTLNYRDDDDLKMHILRGAVIAEENRVKTVTTTEESADQAAFAARGRDMRKSASTFGTTGSGVRSQVVCFNCGKKGHIARQCKSGMKKESAGFLVRHRVNHVNVAKGVEVQPE